MVSSNGEISVVTMASINNNFYMVLWDTKSIIREPIESNCSIIGGNDIELRASLLASGSYVVGIVYRGTILYLAFELEKK